LSTARRRELNGVIAKAPITGVVRAYPLVAPGDIVEMLLRTPAAAAVKCHCCTAGPEFSFTVELVMGIITSIIPGQAAGLPANLLSAGPWGTGRTGRETALR
jgi:hypothetical protein